MAYEKHGLTFRSPIQASKHFGENPIKTTPILIFQSHQAVFKWLPKNLDLIPERKEGDIEAHRHLGGKLKYYTVKQSRTGATRLLAQAENGKYYWTPWEGKAAAYPECEKLAGVSKESQAIGQFLDWLITEKHLTLAHEHEHAESCGYISRVSKKGQLCGLRDDQLEMVHVGENWISLLAEYFQIDLNKVESERRAMLLELQKGG